ncbi:MAG: sigma-70 family RNA polymerase sigma factor [Burkholderiaceae bacterium]|nr:sigma-70 family RNA polymerase sigma factor [Burkholderiaceae bacterium]
MKAGASHSSHDRQARLVALAAEVRPELHRYCARLMGSVIDGEDIVQDTLLRALVALQDLDELPPLRPWLFRVAHNRALDVLRGRSVRSSEPLDAAPEVADTGNPDPLETLMRHEAVKTAISRFVELSVAQRSVVVLKDVLDEPLSEIASLLGLSVDAVKAHLARGRARLRELNAQDGRRAEVRPPSAAVSRYVTLFNQRDWDALRSLLADDVKLSQSTHSLRVGRTEVGMFFTLYAQYPEVWLAPAWLDDQEVVAVFENRADTKPAYMMWLEWDDGRIQFIRDYRYVRYVVAEIELTLASQVRCPSPARSAASQRPSRGWS